MKPDLPRLTISCLLVILLAACNMPGTAIPGTDTGILETKVAATFAALTQSARTPLASPSTPTPAQPTNTRTPTETMAPTNTQAPTATLEPTNTKAPTETLRPTITSTPAPGTIAGSISGYPYGSVPGLAIVAFGQEPPYNYSWMISGLGETYFSMSSSYLVPGHYQVVAYDASGHAGGCTVLVLVISDQTVNCDITDWSAAYPAKPSGVPSP